MAIPALLTALAAAPPPQDPISLQDPPTADEGLYYALEDVPVPEGAVVEATAFTELPDGRLVLGTRRGDVYLVEGAEEDPPAPRYTLFAHGLHEVLGLAQREGVLYATQQGEVTRLVDADGDGRAERYETVSDFWGFGGEHEFAFGSEFDRDGYLWVALCLTNSYTSDDPFRGWALRVGPDGATLPSCSGIRSPGGLGMNAEGVMFYAESQGPWNGACSLKHLVPGKFMGHPAGLRWYRGEPGLGPPPARPKSGGRQYREAERIPELQAPAVVFPYRKMGQSASGIALDASGGRFGPFEGQLFVGDYTLSLVMRVSMEQVDGVWQGACFPFREGFATGVIGVRLTRGGHLFTGGCSRGWPSRGTEPFALQRLSWTGETPFEVLEMSARPDGFELTFTQPAERASAADPASYAMTAYTHVYQSGYGSPEVDVSTPQVVSARPASDGRRVRLVIAGLVPGHVHELSLAGLRSREGEPLLHTNAYYTLKRLPR